MASTMMLVNNLDRNWFCKNAERKLCFENAASASASAIYNTKQSPHAKAVGESGCKWTCNWQYRFDLEIFKILFIFIDRFIYCVEVIGEDINNMPAHYVIHHSVKF